MQSFETGSTCVALVSLDKRWRISTTGTINQHNREIHENIVHWARKPVLRYVYGDFYREIAKAVNTDVEGLIVELGSGMGNIKEHIPACITTDIFPNPWLDSIENAYKLSFNDNCISNLILFDVWHHLQYPGFALREFSRVLRTGGRLIIFDHAMGFLGRLVCALFHHEPIGMSNPIVWEAPDTFLADAHEYYAATGNAHRVFKSGHFREQLKGWMIFELRHFSGIAWLASGGLRGPKLYPDYALPMLQFLDTKLSRFSWLASRMLIVLQKVT